MSDRLLRYAGFVVVWSLGLLAHGQPTDHQPSRLHPVVVTGSYLADAAETASLPATVITSDNWARSGWPHISELVRNLVSVSGVDGETNQFSSNGLAGAANINLRGLGPARTLILFNGRRLAASPFAVDDQAQLFVDLNHLPIPAMDRIEILREGAGSIYGSDAVAGAVHFVTTEEVDGVRLNARYRYFGSEGRESHVSVLAGKQMDAVALLGSVSYDARGRVPLTDREWAVRPYVDNRRGGWSGIGNPGAFVVRGEDGALAGAPVPDAGCASLGGVKAASTCRFQYTRFVNLVEEEERWQAFGEARTELGPADLRLEALWATTNVPRWQTSPSTPPQLWTEHVIPTDHPALQHWRTANPDLAVEVYGGRDPASTELVFLGRPLGVGGNPLNGTGAAEGYRRRTTWRVGADVSVELDDQRRLAMSAFVSEARGARASADTYRAGFVNALQGYGLCSDPVTGVIPGDAIPGIGDCVYFNPFSSAIEVSAVNGATNPGHIADLANSRELIDWLRAPVAVEAVNGLSTFDAIYTSTNPHLSWAVGVQMRLENRAVSPAAENDLDRTPGPDRTGVFSFLAATEAVSVSRAVTAAFAEARYSATPEVSITGALRYENYGPVAALDPKLAVGWRRGAFSVRASAQTSVRGPGLNQIGGVATSLQYVVPTGAFKAVDRHGNADLRPETGAQAALDASFAGERLSLAARAWGIAVRDTLVVYSQSDIVALAVAALESGDTEAGILSRITFQSGLPSSPATIARVRTDIANGPELIASGFDITGAYALEALGGVWRLSGSASYLIQFSLGSYEIDGNRIAGADLVGQFNITNAFRPLPRLKAQASLDYMSGSHDVRLSIRYTGEYQNERASEPIADMSVIDVSYRYRLSERMVLGLAVGNIADTPPPPVAFDLNYDPYTHSPFGRTISLSVSFGGRQG